MDTPIWDFVKKYAESGRERMHVPGHKGMAGPLKVEPYDISEVKGADELYMPGGIIEKSEINASSIFESGGTVYGTEGSSQCIKAMLYLAIAYRRPGTAPLIVAARNVHSAFVHAAALIDFDVEWIVPNFDKEKTLKDYRYSDDIESCPVTMYGLFEKLEAYRDTPPAAVYMTSPDYLGVCQDIEELSKLCHSYDVPLLVDNAHGAYLKCMGRHPLDLGADMCCDSAHKTLPVLTGGAYLHISKRAPEVFLGKARSAMALFGSTSPSYLTLSSLDLCNKYLTDELPGKIQEAASLSRTLKKALLKRRFDVTKSDPLRIVIHGASKEISGHLSKAGIEPEYVSRDAVVLMVSPYNSEKFPALVLDALKEMGRASAGGPGQSRRSGSAPSCASGCPCASAGRSANGQAPGLSGYQPNDQATMLDGRHIFSQAPSKVMSIRRAIFSPSESIPVIKALGRVSNSFLSKCPPGVPIVMPGEMIDETAQRLLQYYGYEDIDVVSSL